MDLIFQMSYYIGKNYPVLHNDRCTALYDLEMSAIIHDNSNSSRSIDKRSICFILFSYNNHDDICLLKKCIESLLKQLKDNRLVNVIFISQYKSIFKLNPDTDLSEFSLNQNNFVFHTHDKNSAYSKNTFLRYINRFYHDNIYLKIFMTTHYCVCDLNWIDTLTKKLDENKNCIISGQTQGVISDMFSSNFMRMFTKNTFELDGRHIFFYSCNCAFYIHTIPHYLWWDTNIYHDETSDIDFSFILHKNNIHVVFSKESVVYHKYIINIFHYIYDYGSNCHVLIKKHNTLYNKCL